MVQSFFLRCDPDRRTTESMGHLPSDTDSLHIPFDGKQSSLQRWHGDAAERLQRMQGANRCAMSFQNAQDAGAPRTTSVQDSPAAQFRAADAREVLSDGGNFVIRRS